MGRTGITTRGPRIGIYGRDYRLRRGVNQFARGLKPFGLLATPCHDGAAS